MISLVADERASKREKKRKGGRGKKERKKSVKVSHRRKTRRSGITTLAQ